MADPILPEERASITPDIPGLKQQEQSATKNPEGGGFYKPDEKESGLVSKSIDRAGSVAAGAIPGGSTVVRVLKKHKKTSAAGGLAVVLIVGLLIGLGGIAAFELKTISEDLIHYESKVEQKFEKKAAQKIFSQIICGKFSSNSISFKAMNCKAAGDEGAEEEAKDPDPLAKDAAAINPDSEPVKTDLEQQGIKVDENAQGEFDGLTDASTGDPITASDIENDTNGAFDKLETALPEWDVGQLESYRPLMEADADASFDVVPATATDNVDETLSDEVSTGANDTSPLEAPGEETDKPPATNDNNPADETNYAESEQLSGITADSVNATEKALEAGKSEPAALKAGGDKFGEESGGIKNGLALNAVSDACSVEDAAESGAKNRNPLIQRLLVRHFTTLISLASQIQTGHITTKAVDTIMKLFNGSGATTTAGRDTPTGEATLSFSASAEWQRVEGNPVDSNTKSSSYTPDVDPSDMPTENSGTKLVDKINNVVDDSGVGVGCSALNSTIGSFIQGFAAVFQVAADASTFGAAEAATFAGNVAFNSVIQYEVIPSILRYFTPVGINGLEDSVQWLNNAGGGGALSYADYSRSLGAEPATAASANQQYALATSAENKAESKAPLTNRLFAVSNPDSLLSRFIMTLPSSKSAMLTSLADLFISIPKDVFGMFGSIINIRASADNPPENPGEPYGITQYDFPDSEVTKYNPIANEEYLYTNITYNNKTATRISLLGNPNNYMNTYNDTSTTDILHCFIQPTLNSNSSNDEESDSGPDPLCGSVGNYDYANDPPKENPTPITDKNVALSYCEQLGGGNSKSCINTMLNNYIHDDIGHFREYLLDVHVMNDYKELTTNQS